MMHRLIVHGSMDEGFRKWKNLNEKMVGLEGLEPSTCRL